MTRARELINLIEGHLRWMKRHDGGRHSHHLDDAIKSAEELSRIVAVQMGPSRSLDEALNSGDGVYRP